MKLEIFKKGKKLKSWGSVYLGIHKNWIDPKWVINVMENDSIKFKAEDYSKLLIARDKPLIKFYSTLKELALEYKEPFFSVNEDSMSSEFVSPWDSFPRDFWGFWEVEFVFQAINSEMSTDEKLNTLEALYKDFYYPDEWTEILSRHSRRQLTENNSMLLKKILLKEITEYANDKLSKVSE